MLKAMNNGLTGMLGMQTMMDTTANNLANMDTVGYKAERVNFSELVQQATVNSAVPVKGSTAPVQQGSGVEVGSISEDTGQGDLVNTGRTLDLAVSGPGYFKLNDANGNEFYTRDGTFFSDSNGNLVNASGLQLADGIQLPADAQKVVISKNGDVTVTTPDGQESQVGQITLYSFANPEGLIKQGGNIYTATAASGTAKTLTPGDPGAGEIMQGYQEQSNVNLIEEMKNMIEAERAYQIDSRSVHTADQMWGLANNLRG